MIQFRIPAVPIAQPRQRHRIVGQHVHNYTPSTHPVNGFKADARKALYDVYKGPPLTGPLCMEIDFVMPRPKRLIWKTRPMPRVPHDGKPDRDNLMKSLQDALENLLFKNDSQICDGVVRKLIAAGDESPHVLVTVTELSGAIWR